MNEMSDFQTNSYHIHSVDKVLRKHCQKSSIIKSSYRKSIWLSGTEVNNKDWEALNSIIGSFEALFWRNTLWIEKS